MRNVYTPGCRSCRRPLVHLLRRSAQRCFPRPVLGRAPFLGDCARPRTGACGGDAIEPSEKVVGEDELSEREGCVAGNGPDNAPPKRTVERHPCRWPCLAGPQARGAARWRRLISFSALDSCAAEWPVSSALRACAALSGATLPPAGRPSRQPLGLACVRSGQFRAVSGVACRVSLRSPRHPTLTLVAYKWTRGSAKMDARERKNGRAGAYEWTRGSV